MVCYCRELAIVEFKCTRSARRKFSWGAIRVPRSHCQICQVEDVVSVVIHDRRLGAERSPQNNKCEHGAIAKCGTHLCLMIKTFQLTLSASVCLRAMAKM